LPQPVVGEVLGFTFLNRFDHISATNSGVSPSASLALGPPLAGLPTPGENSTSARQPVR
jgi:hypothetical protein